MLHALLHGDFAGAFRANALALLSLPFVAWLAWVETVRMKRPQLYQKVFSNRLIIAAGVIMCAWFVGRNIIGV